MVDLLVRRPRGALQESWVKSATAVRRCVTVGRVSFNDLRGVVRDLISVWRPVRKIIKDSAPRHIKTEACRVIYFVCLLFWFCRMVGGFL